MVFICIQRFTTSEVVDEASKRTHIRLLIFPSPLSKPTIM